MQLQQTSANRTAANALGNMDRHDADMAILQEIRKVQALCDQKEGDKSLRDEVEQMRRDRQQPVRANKRLQAQAAATVTTPCAGSPATSSGSSRALWRIMVDAGETAE